MFGSDERLHKRLLEEGRQAQGEVVESRPTTASRGNFPPDRSERRYLWKLKLRLRPEGESEFEVDLKHYFHDWSPPNAGSTMTVLFDPNDHSKVSIDIDSVVSVPPAANLIEGASSTRELQDAQLRSGQGMIEVISGADAPIPDPSASSAQNAAPPAPGSVLSGDQAELIAQLSDRHQRGQLSDADFEKAKRTLLGF
jgi:hypothetical protein